MPTIYDTMDELEPPAIENPPANDVCPDCKGDGYRREKLGCVADCRPCTCNGTGKAPSIEAKPPLASVDAARADPTASGYVPPIPEGWYRLSNGTPLQHGDCFAWEDAWQDVEPSGLAHSGGEFIREVESAGAGTPDAGPTLHPRADALIAVASQLPIPGNFNVVCFGLKQVESELAAARAALAAEKAKVVAAVMLMEEQLDLDEGFTIEGKIIAFLAELKGQKL